MASRQTPVQCGDPKAFVTSIISRKFMSPRRSPTHNKHYQTPSHHIGATVLHGGARWRGAIVSRVSRIHTLCQSYRRGRGGRPGLSDGESFHLLSPPASLNPIEMTMEQPFARSRLLFLPALIRSIVVYGSLFSSPRNHSDRENE